MKKLQGQVETFKFKVAKTNTALDRKIETVSAALKKAKQRERAAKLAAYEDEARKGSQALKRQLLKELGASHLKCPYCETIVEKVSLVLDHIHPIAKGGQTVPQNSILICRKCNSRKSALTLRAFCRKFKYDFEDITKRLEAMNKWV